MTDVFDYLVWRGDIPFSRMGPNPVDALIFAALSYVRFEKILPGEFDHRVSLKDAAEKVLALPETEIRCRVEKDLDLLATAAGTVRFRDVLLCGCRTAFLPQEEAQFAAVTFLLEDGSAMVTFRGTDQTLVGWKEDFNMSFLESVPAQRMAADYVNQFAAGTPMPMRLNGHSKGGNLAVYAGAKCAFRERILEIFNHDGPGFRDPMLHDPGYLEIVPRIHTYVPQSSVIGMQLEHEEAYTIIRSGQTGLQQHNPYTWEVLGPGFVLVEELTADSRFLNRTLKNWLAGMTAQERNDFFDGLFALLAAGDASRTKEIMRPQNLLAYVKTLRADENLRRLITSELSGLIQAARTAQPPEGEN